MWLMSHMIRSLYDAYIILKLHSGVALSAVQTHTHTVSAL